MSSARENAAGKKRKQAPTTLCEDARPTIVDELRPRNFKELTFFPFLDAQLAELVQNCRYDMPNLLFYGPTGAGKRTRAHIVLSQLYSGKCEDGQSVIEKTSEHRILQVDCSANGTRGKMHMNNNALLAAGENIFGAKNSTKNDSNSRSNAATDDSLLDSWSLHTGGGSSSNNNGGSSGGNTIEVACVESPFHIEITPSDAARKDANVIQSCVRHLVSQAMPLDIINSFTQSNYSREDFPNYRVVFVNSADQLHFEAQAAMRRFMEANVSRVRFILIVEKLSKILPALRSRCLPIRVPAPSDSTIVSSLRKVAGFLQIGGRFGGNRQNWSVPRTIDTDIYFNDSNRTDRLPFPTVSMLTKAAQGDFTAAQLLLISNHADRATIEMAATKKASKRSNNSSNNSSTKKESQMPMALVDRDSIRETSWKETIKLVARVFVLGYGAVKGNRPLIAAWGRTDFGPESFEKPMLEWTRRVAHELITRCIPQEPLMICLLDSMLENINLLIRLTENGTCTAKGENMHYSTPVYTVWNEKECDLLRERVIEVIAAFQCRLAVAFRAVVQMDSLFVYLSDSCEHYRAKRPLPNDLPTIL